MKDSGILKFFEIILIPTVIMIWASSYLISLAGQRGDSTLLIRPVFYCMVVLYIINTITDYIQWKKTKTSTLESIPRLAVMYLGIIVAYIFLMPRIGFILTTLAFLYGSFFLLQVKNKTLLYLFPVVFTAILYAVFRLGFSVPLPSGLLPF